MTSVKVCIGSNCHLKGSREIIEVFCAAVKRRNAQNQIDISHQFCMGHCQEDGVCVTVDGQVFSVLPQDAESFIDRLLTAPER